MIEKIDLEQHRINMLKQFDAGGVQVNLFNADSLNILIGDNGAGKTRALRQIIYAMNQFGDSLGCNIDFGLLDPREEYKKFGTIYYTPIPYKVQLPKNQRNFSNASIDWRNNSSIKSIDINRFISLSKILKIPTRPLITMGCDYGLVLPMLARALVRYITQNENRSVVLSEYFPVNEILQNSNSLLKSFAIPYARASAEQNAELSVSKKIRELRDHIFDTILKVSCGRLGVRQLPTLSAVEVLAMESKNLADIGIAFFSLVFEMDFKFESPYRRFNASKRDDLVRLASLKAEIFDAEDNWKIYETGGRMIAEVEYRNSEILAKFPEAEIQNLISVEWENFSSGQLALLYQFTSIRKSAAGMREKGIENILLLIDEGDIFLHASWQRRYVELLNDLIFELKQEFRFGEVQVIITTHSPVVITDIPSSFVVRLSRDNKRKPKILSFAAAPQDVVNSSFGTNSMGSFAQKILIDMAKRIRRSGPVARDEYIISLIDDPIIKREFARICSDWAGKKMKDF
jgi:hypothetical protein